MVDDADLVGHQEPPEQAGDDRRHHQRQREDRAVPARPLGDGAEEQRRKEPEQELEAEANSVYRRVRSRGFLDAARGQHLEIVAETDPGSRVGPDQLDLEEGIVDQKRIG